MNDTANTAEEQQLRVEIEAVGKSLSQQGDASKISYEVEQGRKLIEKAVSLGLPKEAYADLQQHITAHVSETGRR